MSRRAAWTVACAMALQVPVAHAGDALGGAAFASEDSDGTRVLIAGTSWDFDRRDHDHYRGIELERARFAPPGVAATHANRAYFRFADETGGWAWRGRIGTDGDTVLGSVSVHNDAPRRQEYFLERDVVATRQGMEHDLRATFAGAAFDRPLDDRHVLTGLVGVQHFTGGNQRLHLRGRYVAVVNEDWGLSAQLRTRYFRSSEPHQFDYYSPRWHAEVLPVLQVRRFRGGWMYQVAAGVGRQADSDTGWRGARMLEASVTSPASEADWRFRASLHHSTTPGGVASDDGYRYRQFQVEAIRAF